MEFDGVYGCSTSQSTLYKEVFSPLVTGFLQVHRQLLGIAFARSYDGSILLQAVVSVASAAGSRAWNRVATRQSLKAGGAGCRELGWSTCGGSVGRFSGE